MTAFPGHSIALYDVTGDVEAHRKLADVAIRFGNAQAAEPPLRRLIELQPTNPKWRGDLARVLAARSKVTEALDQCAEAERLEPDADVRELCASIREGHR